MRHRRSSIFELAADYDGTLIELTRDLEALIGEGAIKERNGVFQLRRESIPEHYKKLIRLEEELNRNFDEVSLVRRFKQITSGRPKPKKEHWQGFMSAESAVRRARFIHERCDDCLSRILLIGDDDLVSVAISLFGQAEEIVVLDIDEELVHYINQIASEHNFWIRAFPYDARSPLPKAFRNYFDAFVTEPPETLRGLRLFLSRGFQSLQGTGSAGYFGLTHIEASLRKWKRIEHFILSSGFVITDLLRDSARYPEKENAWEDLYAKYPIVQRWNAKPPKIDWYRSSLIRIEAVERIKIRNVSVRSPAELFVDHESWATDNVFYSMNFQK